VTLNGVAALTDDSKCQCTWSGNIEVTDPGTGVESE
jgi:hypothetical protein